MEEHNPGSFGEVDCLPGLTDFQQYQEVVGRLSWGEAVDLAPWLAAAAPAAEAQPCSPVSDGFGQVCASPVALLSMHC